MNPNGILQNTLTRPTSALTTEQLNPPTPHTDTMEKPEHLLAWLDVETTGINPQKNTLLEIGVRITDLTAQHEYWRYSTPINYKEIAFTNGNQTAMRMHVDNELIYECLDTAKSRPLRDAENTIYEQLEELRRQGHTLHPAGTNPDFDMRFIDVNMPSLLKTLSYRKLDLTTLRLTDLAQGRDPYDDKHHGTHRVNDCLNRDTAEYREWLERGARQ